jgi:hypothetical protein
MIIKKKGLKIGNLQNDSDVEKGRAMREDEGTAVKL